MLDIYGAQLIEHAPAHLKVMVRNILPKEMENELLDHPELKTWEQIIEWCRKKIHYKNQKSLASFLKPGSTKINSLQQADDSDDDDDDVVKAGQRKSGSKSIDYEKLTECMVAAFHRNKSKKDDKDQKPRFVWKGGCHECGGDHMKASCDKWKQLMNENGGKMPPGHQNAYS